MKISHVPDLSYPIEVHPSWHVLDNSKLTLYARCPRRFMFKYLMGWGSARPSVHTKWGEAVHLMLAHCYRHGWDAQNRRTAIDLATELYRAVFTEMDDVENAPKTAAQFEPIIEQYLKWYGAEEKFTVLHTEVAFHMQLTDDISIAGRMDLVGQEEDESIFVLDWKTAGRMPNQKAINQWQLSNQMATYLYALRKKYPDHQVDRAVISIIVPYKSGKKPAFLRIPVYLTDEQLELWRHETINMVKNLRKDYVSLADGSNQQFPEFFERRTIACYDFASLCPYFDQCCAWINPLSHLSEGIPHNMAKSYWDPTREKAEEVWNLE